MHFWGWKFENCVIMYAIWQFKDLRWVCVLLRVNNTIQVSIGILDCVDALVFTVLTVSFLANPRPQGYERIKQNFRILQLFYYLCSQFLRFLKNDSKETLFVRFFLNSRKLLLGLKGNSYIFWGGNYVLLCSLVQFR